MEYKSLSDINKPVIINAMLEGVSSDEHRLRLSELLKSTCDYSGLFSDFDSELLTYILPSVRRVYSLMFIDTPPIFSNDPDRLELFKLSFDLDEFVKYLHDIVIDKSDVLDFFENLDVRSEFLMLVVQNYVSGKIKLTRTNNVKQLLREFKLKKMDI
jgi:hypothetical protein